MTNHGVEALESMVTNETVVAGGITAASMWGASFLGLEVIQLVPDMGLFCIGVVCKIGVDLMRSNGRNDVLGLKAALAWVVGGFAASPLVTIMYLATLKMIPGMSADSVVVLGLGFLGYTGPKAIDLLMNNIPNLVKGALGGLAGKTGEKPDAPKE